MTDTKKQKKHDHEWQYVHAQYEFPIGMAGTAAATLYAYLLCQCTAVRRVIVEE